MSSADKPNKAKVLALLQALIAGTQKHTPNGTLTFGGATYTAAALIQEMQNLINAIAVTNAAHVQATDAVQAQTAVVAKVAPIIRGYKRYLQVTLGTANTQLADYGLQPLKARKPLGSDERVAAKAKAAATRKARGTTSKKQKLAVKGDVKSVQITPVTSTPAAAATATPAAATSPVSAK
jgi:hypothetical protein